MAAQSSTAEREVIVIKAKSRQDGYGGGPAQRKIPVAAYARVSTDKDDQLNSYEAQVDYYEQKIRGNPEWEYVKVFADEGLSGTNMKKRGEFNRMIAMCRRGKIKMILCKSFSRFARNTVDCLSIVRELKALEIAVLFEKENINTLTESSEFLITLFSGFAQAESESISANVKWGKAKSMQDGNVTFQYAKLLGYRRGEDGKPEIIPEEAETVLRIYGDYLSGYSLNRIKDELDRDGIPSPGGVKEWSYQVIRNILANEKYTGDALLQKTYTVDCISKQVRKNNGEMPMVLVKNNHDAIISRELFNRVQEEMARRSSLKKVDQHSGRSKNGKFSSMYALTGRLVCGECGAPYKRVTWAKRRNKKIVWRCGSRLENGTAFCKGSPTIEEPTLHAAILRGVNQMLENKDEIISYLKECLVSAIGGAEEDIDSAALRARRDTLDTLLMDAMRNMNRGSYAGDFETRVKEITDEMQSIGNQLRRHEQRNVILERNDSRIRELYGILENIPNTMESYDDRLTAQIIVDIKVLSPEKLAMRFDCGVGIEVAME